MKFRNTLILLAILVALSAYVLLVEQKRPSPEAEEASSLPTPLAQILSFDPFDARRLMLSRSDQNQRTELVLQEDGVWHIAVPVEEEADQGKVTGFLDSLSVLRPRRVLTGTVGPLSDYDLDPPMYRIEIELGDGVAHRLSVGAKTAAGTAYYGQVEEDENVYLLPFSIGADVERYLEEPPVKPTPTSVATLPSTIPPPPTPTATG